METGYDVNETVGQLGGAGRRSAGIVAVALLVLSCVEPPGPNEPAPPAGPSAIASAAVSATVGERVATTPSGGTLHIALMANKARWFLGENILIDYVITNRGASPVDIGFGSDYRGASRHMRYRVVVADASGTVLRDPDPTGFNMGGIGGDHRLDPTQQFVHTLPLTRYAGFEKPGRYWVRVAHDLGWSAGESTPIATDDPRWAELTLDVAEPSPTEALDVINQMLALPEDTGHSLGQQRPPYADFTRLRYPVYLEHLRGMVLSDGPLELLGGIGAIPAAQATQALIELAQSPRPELAARALEELVGRLPLPLDGNGATQAIVTPRDASRQFLSRRAWQPRFTAALLPMALRLLHSRDAAQQDIGSEIVAAIGTKDDYPQVLKALDAALEQSESAGAPRHFPHPRTAHSSLLRVVETLIQRGAEPSLAPATPGAIAAYLVKWGPSEEHPDDYGRLAARWMRHRIPYVRELAVERTRAPLPTAMQGALPSLLKSGELSLQVRACGAVAAIKDPRFAADVMDLAKRARDEWLLRAVEAAALGSAVRRDVVMGLWAERIGEVEMTMHMFNHLRGLIDNSGGSGFNSVPDAAEAARLRTVWSAFVREHASAIRDGKVFSLDGPEVTTALMPRGVTLSRPNR